MDDQQLVEQSINGDEFAFGELIKRYRHYIYRIAYKITLHHEDALDVSQNVFLKLANSLHLYQQTYPFPSWLATVTVNASLDYIRKRNRNIELKQMADVENASTSTPCDIHDILAEEESIQIIEEAMHSLSAQQRAIFTLRFNEDMNNSEIAKQLNLSETHVRVQMHRAIQTLRMYIHKHDKDYDNEPKKL